MSLPDIVYPLRVGPNEELRYSLRSLANLPHGRVWLVGHKPSWVRNVEHIPREQPDSKYLNATTNLVTAAATEEISDPFILWNDDFYLLRRMKRIPVLHRGLVRDVIREHQSHRRGSYVRGMQATARLMFTMGIRRPLSYELHVPMTFHKEPLLEAWEKGQRIPALHIRTLYGNMVGIGGRQVADCKVYGSDRGNWSRWTFISSDEDLRTPIGEFVKRRFPKPSRYET